MELSQRLDDDPSFIVITYNYYRKYHNNIIHDRILETVIQSLVRFLRLPNNNLLRSNLAFAFRDCFCDLIRKSGTEKTYEYCYTIEDTYYTRTKTRYLALQIIMLNKIYEYRHVLDAINSPKYTDMQHTRYFVYCVFAALERLGEEQFQGSNYFWSRRTTV